VLGAHKPIERLLDRDKSCPVAAQLRIETEFASASHAGTDWSIPNVPVRWMQPRGRRAKLLLLTATEQSSASAVEIYERRWTRCTILVLSEILQITSFNHLVGDGEYVRRHLKAHAFAVLKFNRKLVFVGACTGTGRH
jgi:hypothetical protein